MALIVVESPTKARTFNRILKSKDWGKDYFVFATVGHFRDLPSKSLSVDLAHDFAPSYEIMERKAQMVDKLVALASEHKEIILATDLDREGESISYHVAYLLGFIDEKWPDFKVTNPNLRRIVFHEITSSALEEALTHPEKLRIDLIKAQQARRILDRIVGYELSPLLWKKLNKNWLSAGRVQSVALRLIVEREKEISSFDKSPYFLLTGVFDQTVPIKARLVSHNDEEYEQKTKLNLFDGTYEFSKTTIDEPRAEAIRKDLEGDTFTLSKIEETTATRYPPPPYTTSLLQQDAFRKLGYPSKLTMRIAQSLYEKGLITYHRTDSFNLSAKYVFPAKDYIVSAYGKKYALEKPRGFKTKAKNAQEAHEAIRPTKADRSLKELAGKKLTTQEKKLYELIFYRALATQMKEAEIKESAITITSGKGYRFTASHQKVIFDGFLRVYAPAFVKANKDDHTYNQGTKLTLSELLTEPKETKPPYRYSEASLIKTLEEKGIGRPSTYASIISLIIDKHYVEKESRYLKPTSLGSTISNYLSVSFPNIFDLTFTAQMEDSLDDIADGKTEILTLLNEFYKPFSKLLKEQQKSTQMLDVVEDKLEEPCPKCGSELVARYGKFGKFYACKGYPNCKYIKPNLRFVEGHTCPLCQGKLVVRYSKTGKRFYGCEKFPECKHVQWALNPKVETKPEVKT